MNETTTLHVLASVAAKAKKPFSLLAKRQLASIAEGVAEGDKVTGSGDLP